MADQLLKLPMQDLRELSNNRWAQYGKIGVAPASKAFLTDRWRNNNVIITSKRRRFDVKMTLLLRRVPAAGGLETVKVRVIISEVRS